MQTESKSYSLFAFQNFAKSKLLHLSLLYLSHRITIISFLFSISLLLHWVLFCVAFPLKFQKIIGYIANFRLFAAFADSTESVKHDLVGLEKVESVYVCMFNCTLWREMLSTSCSDKCFYVRYSVVLIFRFSSFFPPAHIFLSN